MINKDVRKYLAHKNVHEILIWSWNKPTSSTCRRFRHQHSWQHHHAKTPFPTTHVLGRRNPAAHIKAPPPTATVHVPTLSAKRRPCTTQPGGTTPRVSTPADDPPHLILLDLPPPRAVATRRQPNPVLPPATPMYSSAFPPLAINPPVLPTLSHISPVTPLTKSIPPDTHRYLLRHL